MQTEQLKYFEDALLFLPSKLQFIPFQSKFLVELNYFWPMCHFIPLKTSENLSVSSVVRGYKMGTLARNGLT